MTELASRYNPSEVEDRIYKFWDEKKLFAATANLARKPFSIVIPPPNVTGILHMGHALNNTIQDILIRYHRMKNEEALWMPGTDHAGIATQNVVEKSIARDGLKRQDLGRDKFIAKVWEWREQYGSTIIRQLKKLGASCDWQRLRFTMDDEYSQAVIEAFVSLYKKGLIYQGDYIINWCPRCQTALSDEEAPHHELQGNLYYLRYPFKEQSPAGIGSYILVATTRPETMLADTAVAVNPKDKRYKKFIGETLILPLVNRKIKIIADSLVDMKFGSGAVKVTPAHDPNDYLLGKKHKLEFINILNPDGSLNKSAGDYSGMDRFEAREVILEDLKTQDLLEKVEPHNLSAGHCYRCHTIIEPYLSEQWFVRMQPLAKPAIEAVKKGNIRFYPKRWTKIYLNWMENIQDWCVSRQIWWGHRLPVYYCKKCLEEAGSQRNVKSVKCKDSLHITRRTLHKNQGVIVSRLKPERCPECGSTDIYQDEDVLDTWFSSWLWPFATFGWPFPSNVERRTSNDTDDGTRTTEHLNQAEADLAYFYPTSVLVTAPEIIFFWVARMIMAGLEFMGKVPFNDVYIHGTVRDIEGKKMSKSLGNIIDPLEIIREYGADALRFSLISLTAAGQDIYLSKERFEQGRNFANKVWNASRFILMNLDTANTRTDLCYFFKQGDLDIINRWALSRFYSVLKEINKNLDTYNFNETANTLYSFFWHEFCDWYLELIKPDIKKTGNQIVMYKILEKCLRIMHPIMPFISEEIWQKLPQQLAQPIMACPWPHLQDELIDKDAENKMQFIFEVITAIRNMRSEIEIPAQERIEAKVFSKEKSSRGLIESMAPQIENLARLKHLTVAGDYQAAAGEFTYVLKDMHLVIPLSGIIDIERQKKRIEDKIQGCDSELRNKKATLANPNFIKRAPREIVVKEEERLKELTATLEKLKAVRDGLQ